MNWGDANMLGDLEAVEQSLHEDLSEMAEQLRQAEDVIRFYARRGVVGPAVDDEHSVDVFQVEKAEVVQTIWKVVK